MTPFYHYFYGKRIFIDRPPVGYMLKNKGIRCPYSLIFLFYHTFHISL
ncbi:hypothetical protein BRYFOR_09661 [Marvinbryantia formatexigens DSM 14469]|uniref:Uncharacterized protein n=1 Tax=Marvinbryantia formatexigens DSM 14469 TaxID=478749 RepID=C6LLW1_9FIRM|nr:hypothetical protein BRYFOR_09661 [Marvinbryantia formatexigens DSM 14469]